MHGHAYQRKLLKEALTAEGPKAILLQGPDGSGKYSCALEAARDVSSDEDTQECGTGVEAARDAVAFCRDEPISSPRRIVLVRDVDRLSDAAQDAWLKSLEEPHGRLAVVGVSSDPSGMHPALLSRFRNVIVFGRLSDEDIRSYADSMGAVDDFAVAWCDGLPGMYGLLASSPGAKFLLAALDALDRGGSVFDLDLPDLLSECSKPDPRSVVVHVCRRYARLHSGPVGRAAAAYAASISRVQSANAEIHFQRHMALASRM